MADTVTAVYNFTAPEIGASDDTWGTKLNANWTKVEALLASGFTGGGASAIGVIKSANLPTDLEHNWALKFDGAKNMQLKTAAGVQEGAFGIDAAGGNVFLQKLNSAGTTLARLRLEADGGIAANVGFFKGSAAGLTGFTAAQIPNLDASKITSGIFVDARIPNLAASKITSGVFVDARIPNLNASKTTAGVFAAARIPALPFSQITGIVPISQGGTGDNDAAGARASLGANNASNLSTGTLPSARLPTDSAAINWVAARTAALGAGVVGTYAYARCSSNRSFGSTASGSSLHTNNASGSDSAEGSTLSGTWRCMGHSSDDASGGNTTLWLRVS